MTTLREILKLSNSSYYSRFKHIESSVTSVISNSRIFFPNYTNHDFKHLKNIEENINKMLPEKIKNDLTDEEIFCLLSATLLHDIGMIPVKDEKGEYENKTPEERKQYGEQVRDKHNIRSKCYVENNKEKLKIDDIEADIIGNICKGHRQVNLSDYSDVYSKGKVRLASLSAILRLADECDISNKRESILSEEGVDEETKEEHYRIHNLVKTPVFDYENQIIKIISIAYVDDDKKLLEKSKEKIQKELDNVQPYLKRIGIDYNQITLEHRMDKNYIKKKIILSIINNKNPYSIDDKWISEKEIENCLEELKCDKKVLKENNDYKLTNNIDLFKEIFKMFINEWMGELFFTDYMENMIEKSIDTIKENFGCEWNNNERNLRIDMIKTTPSAFYLLLFVDKSLNNPLFEISANQNGNLMFDSIVSLGLFNDMYHYRENFNFENIDKNFKKFKFFDEEYVNERIVFCKSIER